MNWLQQLAPNKALLAYALLEAVLDQTWTACNQLLVSFLTVVFSIWFFKESSGSGATGSIIRIEACR